MRRFVDWVAAYTLSPPGMVARMVLRAPEAFDPEPWIEGLRCTGTAPDRHDAGARRGCWRLADDGLAWTRSGLAHAAGVSVAVIDGLTAQGVFETVDDPAAAGRRRARSGLWRAPSSSADQQRGGATRCASGRGRRLRRDAARRRHRLGQDRGLFRGGRRGARAGQAGADPAAGNRADARLPRALPGRASAPSRPNGIPTCRRGCAKRSGGRWRRAACGSWPARARRCSCRSTTSA